MTQRISNLNAKEMQNVQLNDMREEGKIKVLVIEEGKCSAFTLPEHGETVIVTSRSKGYKVKFNEEFLL